jgi:hypothetical protein
VGGALSAGQIIVVLHYTVMGVALLALHRHVHSLPVRAAVVFLGVSAALFGTVVLVGTPLGLVQ